MQNETKTDNSLGESAEKSEDEIKDEIEDVMTGLKNKGVLGRMRSLMNGSGNFFDPESGYLKENDESKTGDVLDTFYEGIIKRDSKVVRRLWEEDFDTFSTALEPGSISRKTLLAYWDSNEDKPWYATQTAIVDRQSWTSDEFPNYHDIEWVYENLNK